MNNELGLIIIRTILILIILFGLAKMMGKKQISQMNIYDYLIGIIIGNVAADISLNLERDFISGIVVLVIYCFSSIGVTYFSLKSLRVRKFFSGTPTILINNGEIIVNNLKKEGIDIDSLEEEARMMGHFDLDKINYAILETNGRISFLPKVKDDYVTNGNMKLKIKENKLGLNLIQDGVIMDSNLEYLKKDRRWLREILSKRGYNNSEEIFLLVYNGDREIKIYEYEKDATNI